MTMTRRTWAMAAIVALAGCTASVGSGEPIGVLAQTQSDTGGIKGRPQNELPCPVEDIGDSGGVKGFAADVGDTGGVKGFGETKFVLCHRPTHDKPHTIVVGAPAVAAHLAQGDTCGPCPDDD